MNIQNIETVLLNERIVKNCNKADTELSIRWGIYFQLYSIIYLPIEAKILFGGGGGFH